jgi:hypothetical protein
VGMKHIGYYSAAIGTACSFFFGSVITMGIYYYKKLGVNMFKVYGQIFDRIWVCLILSGMVSYMAAAMINTFAAKFAAGFFAFCFTYAAVLLLFGLNENEKAMVLSKIRRRKND